MRETTTATAETAASGRATTLDDLARAGARRMIELALEVEVEEYLTRHRAAPAER